MSFSKRNLRTTRPTAPRWKAHIEICQKARQKRLSVVQGEGQEVQGGCCAYRGQASGRVHACGEGSHAHRVRFALQGGMRWWATVTRAAAARAELGATFSNFVGVFFAVIEARWLRLLPRNPRQKPRRWRSPRPLRRRAWSRSPRRALGARGASRRSVRAASRGPARDFLPSHSA